MSKLKSIVEYPHEHLRVLGPPASGKSNLLIDRYRHLARGVAAGDSPSTRVITYSSERSRELSDILVPPDTESLGALPVFTYNDLASRVIEESRGCTPYLLVETEERILLDRLIDDNKDDLKNGSSLFRDSERYQKAMLEGIRSLLQHGVDLENLNALKNLDGVGVELHDLILLCEHFMTFLETHRYETFYTVCWEAARCAEQVGEDHPLRRVDLLLVEDFQDVDPGQFELLRTLFPPEGKTKINVFGDPTGARFAFRGTHHRFLMEDFPALYNPETHHLSAGASNAEVMGPVFKRLLEETRGEEAAHYLPVVKSEGIGSQTVDADIRLYVGENEYDEVRTAAAWIKYLIDQKGVCPEEIAVTAKSKKMYEPLLSAAFHQQGIPLETGRTSHQMLRSFLVSLLRVLLRPDTGTSLEPLFASPYRHELEKILQARQQGARLSNGNGQDLRDLMTALIEELSGDNAVTKMSNIFKKVVIPLVREAGNGSSDELTSTFVMQLREAWKHYVDFTKRVGGAPDAAAFLKTHPVLKDDVGPVKPTVGRVGFYSCRELHHHSFPIVCLIGCSETLFPALQVKDTTIPFDALKSRLERVLPSIQFHTVHLRSAEEHLASEYSLLYLALSRGVSSLLVTAPGKFAGEEYPAPGDILSQTLKAAPPEIAPERVEPPFHRIAEATLKGSPNERDAVANRLAGTLPIIPIWWREPCERVEFSLEPAALSESSLNAYIMCERFYFYRKVLRIPEAEMAFFTLGNLLHHSLEKLCKESSSVTALLESSAPERIQALIDSVLNEVEDTPVGSLTERMLRRLLKQLISDFYTIERSREDRYDIGHLEETFEYTYGGYTFRGRIDRMDQVGDRPLLIDYKTGLAVLTAGGMRKRVTECGEKIKNQNWQIPIYSWWLKEEQGGFPIAFYHYLLRPEEEPRLIALYLFGAEAEWEAFTMARGKGRGISYLLENEIKECMDLAVGVADRMFAPRFSFSKTEEDSGCFMCPFKGFCRRDDRE